MSQKWSPFPNLTQSLVATKGALLGTLAQHPRRAHIRGWGGSFVSVQYCDVLEETQCITSPELIILHYLKGAKRIALKSLYHKKKKHCNCVWQWMLTRLILVTVLQSIQILREKNTVDYLVFILVQSLKPCDFFRGESVVFCHVNEVTFGLLGPGCR